MSHAGVPFRLAKSGVERVYYGTDERIMLCRAVLQWSRGVATNAQVAALLASA